jgi:putative membrane protein
MKRTLKQYSTLVFKGMGMGAADVVPGVSGGTIAFISGIYEELLDSIKSININSIKLLFTFKFKEFAEAINFNFLLAIFGGIGISIISIASILKYLLDTQAILTWAFFFGLIAASTILIGKKIKNKSIWNILAVLIGTVLAYYITSSTPVETPNDWWFIFFSGAIAICAMILPGISGAFILLLLGKYHFIITALSEIKIGTILIFVAGAFTGLISFSNILSWLLKKYHDLTIAVLTGFMFGSLNKVWPWKETLETFTNSHGIEKPLIQENILPHTYAAINNQASQLVWAIGLAIFGFAFIWVLETSSKQHSKKAV